MAQLALALGASGGMMSTLSTVATVAGPVLGVVSAIQGISAANEQAAEFERQGKEQRLMASIEAEAMRRQARAKASAERTAYLEGGAFSGTAPGVLTQNATMRELDALTVEFRGEQQQRASQFQAKQAKRSASILDVFSGAIEGFSGMDPLNIGN